jgi:hypothetical protein
MTCGELLNSLFEYVGVFGVVALLVFVPASKTVVGAVLTVIGAFMPAQFIRAEKAKGTIKLFGSNISFGGSLRIGVIVAGLITLVVAGVETTMNIGTTANAVVQDANTEETGKLADAAFYSAIVDQNSRNIAFSKDRIRENTNIYFQLYLRNCADKKSINSMLSKANSSDAEAVEVAAKVKDLCDYIMANLDREKLASYISSRLHPK